MGQKTYSRWFSSLPLFALVIAIGLSPSFVIGYITGRAVEIRLEDILLVLLGGAWIIHAALSGKTIVKKPPLLYPLLIWLGIGLFTTLANLAYGNIESARGFFYFLKEIQFFVFYFYIFYHIKNLSTAKTVIHLWIGIAIANMIWITYQLATGWKIGGGVTYGPSAIVEPYGPLPSGGFFAILFANLINIYLYYYLALPMSRIKKLLLGVVVLSLIIGATSSGSKTSVLAIAFTMPLTLMLYQLKRGGLKTFAMVILLSATLGGILYYFTAPDKPFAFRGYHFNPSDIVKGLEGGRLFVWEGQIKEFTRHNPFHTFFGLGKSVSLAYEESHSQYVRNFVETGVLGSLAFFILIGAVIKKSFTVFAKSDDPFVVGVTSGLLVSTFAMLLMGVAAEVFFSVKIDEVYWSFAALAMASLHIALPKAQKHTQITLTK